MEALLIVGGLLLLWWASMKYMKSKPSEPSQDELAQTANQHLRALNKSLGFAEGQGPTGIVVDGEYRVVNVGQTERMKDASYRAADEIAGILLAVDDLERAHGEAEASGDHVLARKIETELRNKTERALELSNALKRR